MCHIFNTVTNSAMDCAICPASCKAFFIEPFTQPFIRRLPKSLSGGFGCPSLGKSSSALDSSVGNVVTSYFAGQCC